MSPDIDESMPNAARMYDYFLGGAHNFTVDRDLADRLLVAFPGIRCLAMQNRAWLRRVVQDALAAGIRQFLDIGSGVPTMGNVHEIVRAYLPAGERAGVVYVDYEPVAVHHSRQILAQDGVTGWAGAVREDFRHPDAILTHPETTRLIDFDRPVLVLLISVLHFVGPDDHPAELLERYRNRLASGSRLAINHGSTEGTELATSDDRDVVPALYRGSSNPTWDRDRAELRGWFGGWPLLYYPDLVRLPEWQPEPDGDLSAADLDASRYTWCGVAEKP
jgi:hypothetical protein